MGAILIAGASGYIGGRLALHLVDAGVDIRVAGRDPRRLTDRWPSVDAVELDVMRPETIGPATEGVTTAYYLIHSMEEGRRAVRGTGPDRRDELRAGCGQQRRRADVFLGGLGDDEDPDLSPRLASRHETGRLLDEHGPAVLELRAGMVISAGSASFRMLEDLVRRLPVMVTPRWVDTRSQPIAIDDVVTFLDRAREVALDEPHTIVEIGGADVLSYREMMRRLGAMRGRVSRDPARPGAQPIALVAVVRPRDLGSSFHREAAHRGTAERDDRARRHGGRTSSPTSTRSASTRPSRGPAPSLLPPKPVSARR